MSFLGIRKGDIITYQEEKVYVLEVNPSGLLVTNRRTDGSLSKNSFDITYAQLVDSRQIKVDNL